MKTIDDHFLNWTLEWERAQHQERSCRIDLEDQADRERSERIARLKLKDVPTEIGDKIDEHIIAQIVEANDSAEGLLTLIMGDSHSGKSHIRRRLERIKMLQPRRRGDGHGIVRPYLAVVAPAPSTLKALGASILNRLNPPSDARRRKMPSEAHAIWEQVRAELKSQGVAYLFIDEIHNLFVSTDGRASQKELEATAKTLKTLMVNPDFPVNLVLFGTQKESSKLPGLFKELETRTTPFSIEPLRNAQDVVTFVDQLTSQYEGLDASPLREGDIPERLLLATGGHRGRLAKLLVDAARHVVNRGHTVIDRDVLAESYMPPKDRTDTKPFAGPLAARLLLPDQIGAKVLTPNEIEGRLFAGDLPEPLTPRRKRGASPDTQTASKRRRSATAGEIG
ncbi:hypothetical protein RHAL1_00272 [Beijerinckiaceae bacterium RH AL1]|nr:hypothetical protein RHAL8_00260 [Beijerinckiaceae bacterium RH AL8]VVB42586.1 hypothetical protein RHCH11_RHCH11_00261 [Beijerinckiaceae bacterium RH CH11]VVC53391.1 hypothetical protein RHAL1_00272 [Beijerinckiaceae bacterium RH AL1]